MESASLSARVMRDSSPRATEDLISQIFSQLVALEDMIMAGKAITRSLADPISRIDGQGPTFGPDHDRGIADGSRAAVDANVEPPLIGKLERIRDRIMDLQQLQSDTNKIAGVTSERLNSAV